MVFAPLVHVRLDLPIATTAFGAAAKRNSRPMLLIAAHVARFAALFPTHTRSVQVALARLVVVTRAMPIAMASLPTDAKSI
jgi:hypothetical protein